MLRACRVLALLGFLASSAGAANLVGVYPASPVAGEQFVFIVGGNTSSSPAMVTSQSLSIEGTSLVLSISVDSLGFSVGGFWDAPATVNGLPAGTYQIVAKVNEASQVALPAVVGSVTVQPSSSPSAPAFTGLSSNWFSDDESGWGANVIQGDSGQLFAVWLTYAPQCLGPFPRNIWFVMPTGKWVSPSEFRGLLYATSGSAPDVPWTPTNATANPIGVLSMSFSSPSLMLFDGQFFTPCGTVEKAKSVHKLQF